MEVWLRDLNVITKNRIKLHLQRANARPLALALFNLGHELLAVAAEVPQFIQFSVNPALNHTTIAQRNWRLAHDGSFNGSSQIAQWIGQSPQTLESSSLKFIERSDYSRNLCQRRGQRQHIARICCFLSDAAQQSFQIKNAV